VTNGKHRARWLAELVSDTQHYLSRAREAPEADLVRRAAALLQDARRVALAEVEVEEDKET
jgi:DNA-binding MurR/RpiR family transcriptional regulator